MTEQPDGIRNEFGLSLWAKDNQKPGLIYFYWSDSSDPRGKKTQLWNRDFFDTEDVARASKHYLCFKVDASKQDPALLKKRGLDPAKMPALVVTSPTGKFICILPEVKSNVALKVALEEALAQHFPDLWKAYDRVYLELEKVLEAAREDYKKNNYQAALEKLAKIIENPVRTSLIERAEELQDVVKTKLDNLERKQK